MMTKSIRIRMYMNIAMLILFLLVGFAIAFVNQARADIMPIDKTQVIEVKTLVIEENAN